MRGRTTIAWIAGALWLGSTGDARALRVEPETIRFAFSAGQQLASGVLSVGFDGVRRLDLRLRLDSFKLKDLAVRVIDPVQGVVRTPCSVWSAEGPGVDLKKSEIKDGTAVFRFRAFKRPLPASSDPFSIAFAEDLRVGDLLLVTLRKGRGGQTLRAAIVPEPSTALQVALGLGLLGWRPRCRRGGGRSATSPRAVTHSARGVPAFWSEISSRFTHFMISSPPRM